MAYDSMVELQHGARQKHVSTTIGGGRSKAHKAVDLGLGFGLDFIVSFK